MGVSTTPGEIVLTRIPSATYSIAKARLNAGMVDLVMTGSEMGAPARYVPPMTVGKVFGLGSAPLQEEV